MPLTATIWAITHYHPLKEKKRRSQSSLLVLYFGPPHWWQPMIHPVAILRDMFLPKKALQSLRLLGQRRQRRQQVAVSHVSWVGHMADHCLGQCYCLLSFRSLA